MYKKYKRGFYSEENPFDEDDRPTRVLRLKDISMSTTIKNNGNYDEPEYDDDLEDLFSEDYGREFDPNVPENEYERVYRRSKEVYHKFNPNSIRNEHSMYPGFASERGMRVPPSSQAEIEAMEQSRRLAMEEKMRRELMVEDQPIVRKSQYERDCEMPLKERLENAKLRAD